MFRLDKIIYKNQGKTISYRYNIDANIAKYFNKNSPFYVTYDIVVNETPASIAVIPLLSNIMPIAWFAGFDVFVEEIDEDFYQAMKSIHLEFSKYHPDILKQTSKLRFNKLVKNSSEPQKSAMLFSGGVDAFATYFNHHSEKPDLITIQGADIDLADNKQWEEVKAFNANEPILAESEKHYVQTNFLEFYTYNVDLLLPNLGWWGNIQHGLALICVLAPLSYVKKYNKIYIASTRSIHMEFSPWGSMPEIDEKISWAGLEVIHDGFEFKRQDKVDNIIAAVNKLKIHTTIRVCYSDIKETLNCSRCEKCIRTMFGIVLAGDNPNHYGFKTDASIYDAVKKTVNNGFKTRGTQFFWSEILEKAYHSTNVFVFSDAISESQKRQALLQAIDESCKAEIKKPSNLKKIKYLLINTYPKSFQFYLKIRRSL